ncbi:hypothetical protein PSH58_28070 [Pseudomonas hefeiensis]|uniref:CopG family transcriptional regulator n=1 Tax=Pseudomonas hefeiensis TaxID=2738125 RepID=A0ABY9GAF7_9PSED|nr:MULTISPECIES: hypothetical protein [unclassified Pseudomonas]WLH12599.1 hypothetical protein PSH57_28050 [Pseudomonas sp. FP205]WLH95657.1 hypothetical protein PSH58_28070 [Pseudomonas sp. FP53]WLI39940.1 hypothetical protein PSH74_28075 [Pseudomonas sp. FP821]
MTLANGQPVVVTGKDEPHLLLGLMSVLVELIPADERSAMPPVSRTVPADKQTLEATMQPTATTKITDERTQAARLQIGLTTKVSLHELVRRVAKRRGVSLSIAARDLVQDGLTRFDKESRTVDPSELLTDYERTANDYEGADSESWIIRADRRLVMRTRLRAGEYERSLSSFTNFLLANALSHCPHAAAVREATTSSITSDEAVVEAIKAIERVSGVKARALAPQIDLGEQRGLTNMILGGSVLAPARVLAKLAVVLKKPLDVVSVALERRFATQCVPAFKATDGKPTVQAERKAWSVAVKELQLPAEEQERLLNLEG